MSNNFDQDQARGFVLSMFQTILSKIRPDVLLCSSVKQFRPKNGPWFCCVKVSNNCDQDQARHFVWSGLTWFKAVCKSNTVDSEIFAMVLFSRNFAFAKFRENEILAKWQNHLSFTDIGKSCHSRDFFTSKICF